MELVKNKTPSADVSKHVDAITLEPGKLQTDWIGMYARKPAGNRTLFELEAMVAKRMEFLAWMDQLINSPASKGFEYVLDEIGARLPEERRRARASVGDVGRGGTTLGRMDDEDYGGATSARASGRRSASAVGVGGGASASSASSSGFYSPNAIIFEPDEDLTSHLLCRFAFCMSERWRNWFCKTEELLLRGRLKLEIAKDPFGFLVGLMKRNGLPCEPLTEKESSDPRVLAYVVYRGSLTTAGGAPAKTSETRLENYYTVPLALATRLIKNRNTLCHRGRAILFRDQVQEVFVTLFRTSLARGLHEAYLARVKQQASLHGSESEKATVMAMLDVFLEQFVSDPADALEEGVAGSMRAGDVQQAAQIHFPLCMRHIDTHLRRSGHLKHHGRFTYGLFLKAIGLSMEDSLALFSTLMTVKGGGGSVEAFAKTAYGYNVRHNYGMEGKKTSYSSASCVTIINLPPAVDKDDCHGCPFRTCDADKLRTLVSRGQPNPLNKNTDVRPSMEDIEEIVKDSQGGHYTRACYRYFMATHPSARRDTLFRSPYEYYTCSREHEKDQQQQQEMATSGAEKGATGTPSPSKRTAVSMATPTLNEDNVRRKL